MRNRTDTKTVERFSFSPGEKARMRATVHMPALTCSLSHFHTHNTPRLRFNESRFNDLTIQPFNPQPGLLLPWIPYKSL